MSLVGRKPRGEKVVRPKRVKGSPRPMWGFRPTAQVEAFLTALPGERSGNVVELLELAVHLREAMGVDYWEIERQAKVEGLSTGAVMARLLKASMAKPKK